MQRGVPENPDAEVIEKKHLHTAISWIDFNLMRQIKELKQRVSGSEFEAEKKEILNALRKKPITWSTMMKRNPFSKYKPEDLKRILSSLETGNLAIPSPEQKTGKGRPSILWTAT